MYNKKNFILILFCALIFIGISSVCASDDLGTNGEVNIYKSDMASFGNLEKDIGNLKPGDVYNVDKDYVFDNKSSDFNNRGITVGADNVTINGNGHVIDGSFKSAIFSVTGNNVKIFNLTFANSKYNGLVVPIKGEYENGPSMSSIIAKYTVDTSPVCWLGDNGLISGCVFSHNTAITGGALTWMGSYGLINNTLFVDNVAGGVGGAVYMMMGSNNTIANTVFRNSTSKLFGDAIYLDNKSEYTNISNCTCSDDVFIINAEKSVIDAENLKYSYYSHVADRYIDLIPVMFKSVMCGVTTLDDDFRSYVTYVNKTGDLTFSLVRNFKEFNITYQKNYLITNTTLRDAFKSLIHDNFKNNLIVTKSVNVTDKKGYESVCHCTREIISNDEAFFNVAFSDFKELFKDSRFNYADIHYALNVFYAPGSVFQSNAQWREDNGFDVVNIYGNGAKIKASSGDRQENKWIVTAQGQAYIIDNLTVERFNTAIDNREGFLILNNVHLNHNRMDYIKDRDDGAAIFNLACVICNNCTFSDNYAKNGGAIYNEGLLNLTNCSFKANNGYGVGDDVLNVADGIVFVDGVRINGTEGAVTHVRDTHENVEKVFVYVFAGMIMAAVIGIGVLIACCIPPALCIAGCVFAAVIVTCGIIAGVYIITTVSSES